MTDKHVVYYSRTGTTRSVATDLDERFADATVHRIRPKSQRSYPNWLARSFVPGSSVDIEPMRTDLTGETAVFIGVPKWTLSCPPVTEFLDRATLTGVPLGLFVTYGGFDEKRYTEHLVRRLKREGADVRATLLVQRDELGTAQYDDGLSEFTGAVLGDDDPGGSD